VEHAGALGLPGIGQKQLQGATYHLHNDSAFLRLVASDNEAEASAELPTLSPPPSFPGVLAPESVTALLDWVERGHWGCKWVQS
jgi:hypothetical protein